MVDNAHRKTEKKLSQMKKHLIEIYSQAQIDVKKKADEYFYSFKKQDESMRKLVDKGKLSEDDYIAWRKVEMIKGKRYKELRENIAKQLYNVNETATAYINGRLPEIYALNYNSLKDLVGYSFSLIDADTVKHLAESDSSLLPYRKLDPAKDIPWNMKKINNQVLQGIIQGEDIPHISERIMKVQEMNRDASIRSARTIVTGAENKGRVDSYKRAEQDGIILEQEWVATGGKRTRDWHRSLNGVRKAVGEPFENEIGMIRYPGDPQADGANVYNCRCTLIARVKGFKKVRG